VTSTAHRIPARGEWRVAAVIIAPLEEEASDVEKTVWKAKSTTGQRSLA
jgi:hypothetical protein